MKLRNRINFLMEKAHLKLSPEEIKQFEKDLVQFKDDLKILDEYSVENIEPLRQPFEKSASILRDDNLVENNSSKIMENSSNSINGYVLLTEKESKKNVQ